MQHNTLVRPLNDYFPKNRDMFICPTDSHLIPLNLETWNFESVFVFKCLKLFYMILGSGKIRFATIRDLP